MPKKIQPALVAANKHRHLKLDNRNELEKDEAFFYFQAEWQGKPAFVVMQADRYRHSSGVSEWRVYATDARYGEADNRGAALTDTGKQRLHDAAKPLVLEWLASPEAELAERQAYYGALLRMANELSHEWDARRLQEAMTVHAAKITPEQALALQNCIFAYGRLAAAQEAAKATG
jgi:hypothetical protein